VYYFQYIIIYRPQLLNKALVCKIFNLKTVYSRCQKPGRALSTQASWQSGCVEGSSLGRITNHNNILQERNSKTSYFLECGKVLSGLLGRPGRTPEDLPHGPHADAEDKGSEGPIDPRNLQQESYKGGSRYKRPEKAGGKGFLPPP